MKKILCYQLYLILLFNFLAVKGTRAVNDCRSSPCKNGGTCQNRNNGYWCICTKRWEGRTCSNRVNECRSNPCKNGATCQDRNNGFWCKCKLGYVGRTCSNKVNECLSNPCKNGATCQDRNFGYWCICKKGWTGKTCSNTVNECLSNPCKNGGTCQNGINEYKCTCMNGWTGETCNTDMNECASGIDKCSSTATCYNTQGSFKCTCNWGYKGDGFSCSSQLEYRCNPDDSINVFNLPVDSNIFAVQVVEDGNDVLCTVVDDNATSVTLTGCSKDKDIIITYGSYSGLATYNIHGGKKVMVTLVCQEIAEEGVIHKVRSSFSTQLNISERVSVDPLYSVTSSLSTTSTTVGNDVIWTILFPEQYSLEVSNCTARPGPDNSSDIYVTLISIGGCSVSKDLISDFGNYSNGTITATFEAFKFYNSDSVLLECSLKVCPSETDAEACMNTCSRQKRSLEKRASERPRSVISMTVSNVLYVAEATSSGTLQCIHDVPMTTMLTLMIVLTKGARE